jgi:hypothetical protein
MKIWLLCVLLGIGGSAATPAERDVKVEGHAYGSVLVGDTVEVKYRPDIEKSEVLSEDICLHVKVLHRKTKQLASDREFSFFKSPNMLCWLKGENSNTLKSFLVVPKEAAAGLAFQIYGQLERSDTKLIETLDEKWTYDIARSNRQLNAPELMMNFLVQARGWESPQNP